MKLIWGCFPNPNFKVFFMANAKSNQILRNKLKLSWVNLPNPNFKAKSRPKEEIWGKNSKYCKVVFQILRERENLNIVRSSAKSKF